jgi:SAM-dependent methyltransferase
VLDFGCGAGENIVPLLERGAHIIGLDVSPELVGLARQRVDGAGLKADLRCAATAGTGQRNIRGIPAPSERRHWLFREGLGIYRFHETVTGPTNLLLTRLQCPIARNAAIFHCHEPWRSRAFLRRS